MALTQPFVRPKKGDTGPAGAAGSKGDTGAQGLKGDSGSGSLVGILDDLTDVNTAGQARDLFLRFNGSQWVPATANQTFAPSIASFVDNQTNTQLIGAGVWKALGDIAFSASYENGPPTGANIAASGGSSWVDNLVLGSPFTSGASAEGTSYPSAKDSTITFTLYALISGTVYEATQVVVFRNNIKYGPSSVSAGIAGSQVNALSGTLLSNAHVGSFAATIAGGEYLYFAHPSSYTTINTLGFIFNGVTCPFEAVATVSVTNDAGFAENYKVYRSTQPTLGTSTLVTSTSSSLINHIRWGVSTVASGYVSNDIALLSSSDASNTKGRSISATPTTGEYIVYALPQRLGSVLFYFGANEGGFIAPEVVSCTNVNGYTENYYVYRSLNSNLGSTTLTVV